MAFRKRNVTIGRAPATESDGPRLQITQPGIRPSPLMSHQVTSTGTPSLDDLCGGHAGLPLGSSLIIEESGTTDFAGALLRCYAAEGICQGHGVHVVGVGEGWVRELPGVAEERSSSRKAAQASDDNEKMRIAWRYQNLGQAGERALPNRSVSQQEDQPFQPQQPFCHTFDLTKRLAIPQDAKINHIPIRPSTKPFDSILQSLRQVIESSPPGTIHRLVIPTILSPALWPPNASRPETFLGFLHSLRSLLRQHAIRLTAIMTLPLELYPRNSGLVRWAEILSDGVIELTAFPHLMDASNSLAESGGARGNEEQPQGMLRVLKIPVNTERGEGGAGAGNSMGEDLAFTVSRRKFAIKPFSLPPLEGDQEAQKEAAKLTGKDVEF